MAREWQQTRMTDYLMPDTVYYQSIWAVRDLDRMQKRIKQIRKQRDRRSGASILTERGSLYTGSSPVEKFALEEAVLEERVEAIKKALGRVPEQYRSYILANIILKNPGSAFPDKVWRSWKQIFLYAVARNLSML